MTGKVLLPLLGGSPAVWNTCMVFFQGLLLLGYLYSHIVSKYLPVQMQVIVHGGVLLLAGLTLPAPIDVGTPEGEPVAWLLKTLTITVGLPFFAVSTTGPLVQRWFSRTDDPAAKDPYFLYGASNAGSLLGLLAYPLAVEPGLTRQDQMLGWTFGFWALLPLLIVCGVIANKRLAADRPVAPGTKAGAKEGTKELAWAPITWKRRVMWVLLAAVPSSLMVGVTQHISTDVAAVPLLWIVPLALYLCTFIFAFSRRAWSASLWGRLMIPAVGVLMLVLLTAAQSPLWLIVPIHLIAFTVVALMCHTRLAEDRPDPVHLTEFYLWMSVGGVIGGAFNAAAAPVIFATVLEYPLVLGLSCLLRPQIHKEQAELTTGARTVKWVVALVIGAVLFIVLMNIDAAATSGVLAGNSLVESIRRSLPSEMLSDTVIVNICRGAIPVVICVALVMRRGSARFAVAALALLVGSEWIGATGRVLYHERTFFGVHEVLSDSRGSYHTLRHGTTRHGIQARFEEGRRVPSTYYHRSGPLGDVMRVLEERDGLKSAGFIGLGAGTAAAYAKPGSTFVFYEIDPAVVRIAQDPALFTYVADAVKQPGVRIGFITGDGRLTIRSADPGSYGLVVVDAFSSDAIPVHLITREAVEMYVEKLAPRGVLAFHVSNRYFDLTPVLARLADEFGLVAYLRNDIVVQTEQKAEGKLDSIWVVLARKNEDLGAIAKPGSMWVRMRGTPSMPLWTDDHANLLRVFVGW